VYGPYIALVRGAPIRTKHFRFRSATPLPAGGRLGGSAVRGSVSNGGAINFNHLSTRPPRNSVTYAGTLRGSSGSERFKAGPGHGGCSGTFTARRGCLVVYDPLALCARCDALVCPSPSTFPQASLERARSYSRVGLRLPEELPTILVLGLPSLGLHLDPPGASTR
jgi:hypothetical protein